MNKKGFIRFFPACLCLIFFCCSLCGCHGHTAENTSSDQSSETSTVSEANTEKLNIVFIGNSLTFAGDLPEQFRTIAKSQNKNVQVTNETESAYTLAMHVEDANKGTYYKKLLQKADMVIFQEYGAPRLNTEESLKTLISYVSTNTKIYFLLTEYDITYSRESELQGIKNLTFIPSGYVHNNLLNSGYKYAQFHQPNDYHPNELYGYIAALTVYSVLFNEPVNDVPYKVTSVEARENAYKPSDPNLSKEDCIREMNRTVTDTVAEYQSKADTQE